MISFLAVGQMGNEWIDFNQSYYKIKIAEDGFYRVTQEELQAVGFPLSSVPASRVQLFRRGEEVALNVNANSDGTLNYLEFYGQRNNGESDSPLYEVGDQSHTFYNLFSDSATYFLTYKLGNESAKRMTFSTDKNTTGLTPEAFHIEDTIQLFTSNYASGAKFGAGSAFSLSKYDNGEGWTGDFQSKNVSKDFNFNLEDFEISGTNPVLETVLVGGNSLNHNVEISVGPNTGSLGVLSNVEFSGWGKEFHSVSFDEANVGSEGAFVVRITAEGFPEAAERISVAYVQIKFPQTIELGTNENKVFTLNAPDTKAWLQIPTTNADGTRLFDITDPINSVRLATTNFSDRVEVVAPNAVSGDKILAVTTPLSIEAIEEVTLLNFDLSNKDYLIVSHQDLRTSGDPVADYANYRSSVAGGNHNVQIANISDLFNLYSYGDPSPLAIRNFIIDANNQNDVSNVFLIGKGFTLNNNYYRGTQEGVNVPTYGLPGSDLMFTLGIGSDPQVPGIPIGRLNAFEPADVTAYLNKVIEMESLPFNNLFRKDFLQLSGGVSEAEINSFINIVQGFTGILEQDFIGGRAFNTSKISSEAVEFIDVADRVNQGVGYITFFGHSSGAVTDIEIGSVSDPSFGFSNKGKYPMFLVNGCKAGEIYGGGFTFGEDWMITPDLGAIAFMAHADVALSSTLKRWSDLFYGLGYGDDVFIGESIGSVIGEVSRRYLDEYGTSNINLTQVQQMTLQGDPALRLFGADHPDYEINNSSIISSAINANEILATQDSFKIDVIVKNFGRSVLDSLIIQVNRTLPNGAQEFYVKRFDRVLRQDTLEFYIQNDPIVNNSGQNLFTVILDPENGTEELNESNNTATHELTIYSGNTAHLYPPDNGTQSDSNVEFIWQSSNLLEDERSYDLEIDTQSNFLGPNHRTFTVTAEVVARQSFDFSAFTLPDSSTVYWRTRYANPEPDEANEWVESSFTFVNGLQEGWGQYDPEQVEREEISGIQYNQTTNQWEFIENTTSVDIFTYGIDNSTFTYEDLEAIIGGVNFFVTSNPLDPVCETNTFNAIAFDKESGDPYRPIEASQVDVFNREVCGRIPQRIYQFREQDLIGAERRLQVLVDNMRDGDMIVMFNIGNINYSAWDAPVIATLESLGVSGGTIGSLEDGQPVIFLGRKGDSPGAATIVVDNGSATPRTQQSIDLQDEVVGKFISGEIRSRRIGPALNWELFSYNISEETNDNISIEVYGVDPDGNLTTLHTRARAESIDIAGTDPVLYPQLELSFSFDDETDQTPPQLNFWEVNYQYPPEGILLPDGKTITTIMEGEEIQRDFYFYNPSTVDFSDSLSVMATLINQNSGSVTESSFKIAPALAGDTSRFTTSFPSFNLDGSNSLIVEVLANENEAYTANNRLTLANYIEVKADETNPILDVTFDGYHIIDGDVVSPNPSIVIKMRDDNPFIVKNDTIGVNLLMKLAGDENQFQRIHFSDPRLNYTPATEEQDFQMEFQPGPLENGVHSIQVQAQDEAGNQAGQEPYEVSFEVINESTITHFYPYPNPFSTNCRFVFTLTGSQIPDEMKIQIMTVSGRVVREITQDEIGTVRIGNNITNYAWDGRDEFGDQLANGVYFYKVFIKSNGEKMQHRATSADRAFKHGFGKLYILR
nr:C25 family cysteine peptidase [Ekhidna lutea]